MKLNRNIASLRSKHLTRARYLRLSLMFFRLSTEVEFRFERQNWVEPFLPHGGEDFYIIQVLLNITIAQSFIII